MSGPSLSWASNDLDHVISFDSDVVSDVTWTHSICGLVVLKINR